MADAEATAAAADTGATPPAATPAKKKAPLSPEAKAAMMKKKAAMLAKKSPTPPAADGSATAAAPADDKPKDGDAAAPAASADGTTAPASKPAAKAKAPPKKISPKGAKKSPTPKPDADGEKKDDAAAADEKKDGGGDAAAPAAPAAEGKAPKKVPASKTVGKKSPAAGKSPSAAKKSPAAEGAAATDTAAKEDGGGDGAATAASGPKSKVSPKGKIKTPVGKGKMKTPVGKGAKTPAGKGSPAPPAAGETPPPPAPDGASPSPPPPPRDDDSPSPPPPPSDSPEPPPLPDDSTPRAGGDASPPPPAEPIDEKKLQEQEAKRKEEEQRRYHEEIAQREREKRAAHMAALLSAPTPVFTVKILIGAEDELLPNWSALKMMAEVPMSQPCRPFLEKVVLAKTGWESMEGKTFYKASGNSPKTLRRINEVFQSNMNPTQLGMEPGVHYVWLNRTLPDEEPVYTPGDFFQARLERYYEFYDEQKLPTVESVLFDFRGHEHVLMIKLKQKYGIEPTAEMIQRKRAWIQRQKEILEAAEIQAARGTFNTNSVKTLQRKELRALIGVMEHDSVTKVRFDFFKKWERFQAQEKMNGLIIQFLQSNIARFQRSNFYWKLKSHGNIRLYRGHLHVASQIAVKSQSLLGELAEENKTLKEDIKKKLASIDVLENANTKRLETLYASAETAVHELRVMAGELRAKEREVAALEQQLLRLGGQYVDAVEAKEAAVTNCATRQIEWERDEENFNSRLKEMRLEHEELSKQLDTLHVAAGKKGDLADCPHCEHYDEVQDYAASVAANLSKLKVRVAEAEKAQNAMQKELLHLMREDSDATAPGGDGEPSSPTTAADGGKGEKTTPDKSNNKDDDEGHLNNSRDASASPGAASAATAEGSQLGEGGGSLRSGSSRPMSAMARLQMLRSASGGANSRGLSSLRGRSGTAGGAASAADDEEGEKHVRESELFRQSSVNSDVLAQISRKSQVERANLSMHGFFSTDELEAVDRVRISLDRQTAPRNLNELAELIKRDPMSVALKNMEREHLLLAARQAALAALSPQQKQRRDMYNQQMADAFAHDEKFTRPPPQTNHGKYATLPLTSSSSRMLNTIFSKG